LTLESNHTEFVGPHSDFRSLITPKLRDRYKWSEPCFDIVASFTRDWMDDTISL